MLHGKNRRETANTFKNVKKWLPLVLGVALAAVLAVGSLAFLKTQTDKVKNTFQKGIISVHINEAFDGSEKKNVSLTNNGSAPERVRASVTVNWVDADGNICGQAPVEGVDFEVSFGDDWTWNGDSFCYDYKGTVGPGETTTNLINYVRPVVAKEGYTLMVDIAAQAIQADAAEDAWD